MCCVKLLFSVKCVYDNSAVQCIPCNLRYRVINLHKNTCHFIEAQTLLMCSCFIQLGQAVINMGHIQSRHSPLEFTERDS